ncbi:MAG: GNAT family N-acetyltransferase, partial [Blastocatellia bacterium]
PCLMIEIAEEERGIAGYVVAEIGGADYWRGFVRRHPLAAARILWKRAIKRFVRLRRATPLERGRRATPPPPRPVASPANDSERTWQDRGLNIARVQQIAVHPEYRERGVGTRLYERLFDSARRLGVNRVDAHIDLNNDASVALHRRSGWTVVKRRDYFFATIDL